MSGDTTEAMRAALAPCPFCGGAPRVTQRPYNCIETEFFHAVACYCGGYSACAHKMAVRPTAEEAQAVAADLWNRRSPAAPAVTDSTHTGAATADQMIELTAHLERKRAAAIAETVRVLPIGGHDADAPTQFHAGFALACEEIAHRLKTEAWGMLPNGGFGPTGAANEDDRPSPEFLELLRRALAAQPYPERNDREQPRGTDAQIRKERELTCAAIDGAMAFGYRGDEPPPDDAAWLRSYYQIGADKAQQERERNDCEPVARIGLTHMGTEERPHQWYLDGPDFYCDVERDDAGAWTVFFRDQKTGQEGFGEYTPPPPAERHYCERCGKRLGSTLGVHICTPPGDDADGWMPIETAPKHTEHGVVQHLLLGYAPDETHEDGFVSQGYWMEADDDGPDNMGHDAGFVDVHFTFFSCGRSFGAESYRSSGLQPTHWRHLPTPPAAAPKEPQQ